MILYGLNKLLPYSFTKMCIRDRYKENTHSQSDEPQYDKYNFGYNGHGLPTSKMTHEVSFDSIPAVFPTPVGVFSFTKNDSVPPLEEDMNLVAYVNSPTDVAESYVENLSVRCV